MKRSPYKEWKEANERYLWLCVAELRLAILHLLAKRDGDTAPVEELPAPPDFCHLLMPPALDILCEKFELNGFQRALILLCLAMEFDPEFGALCARVNENKNAEYPTLHLALQLLPEPDRTALSPQEPLRYWRMIDVGEGYALMFSPLRIDERIFHFLVGIQHLDNRLIGYVAPVNGTDQIAAAHVEIAERIARTWAQQTDVRPVFQLSGDEIAAKRAIAAHACRAAQFGLQCIIGHNLPTAPGELQNMMRLWEREALLSGHALLLDCDEMATEDSTRESAIFSLIERLESPIILLCRRRRAPRHRPMLVLDVEKPPLADQRDIWRGALGSHGHGLDKEIDRLIYQFNLDAPAIHAVCLEANASMQKWPDHATSPSTQGELLWEICRTQTRPRLSGLVQRVETRHSWDDLVLREPQMLLLREIAMQVRQRRTVYEEWGFNGRGLRGLGIAALFAGTSGTGKTLASEVIANELHLDLYRIDLSAVVSKYIGETEKNLREVFDAAEESGAILLFDEADALFGKRSEVKDSHDRYANIEVSYLLQRMEAYRGLAILTTNLSDSLDGAFTRRLRYIVHFTSPDLAERAQIWRRVFPKETPTSGLDYDRLARLNMQGGLIRNIALNAAFLAAEDKSPVTMATLLRAVRTEYNKLGKSLTEAEIKGWVS